MTFICKEENCILSQKTNECLTLSVMPGKISVILNLTANCMVCARLLNLSTKKDSQKKRRT